MLCSRSLATQRMPRSRRRKWEGSEPGPAEATLPWCQPNRFPAQFSAGKGHLCPLAYFYPGFGLVRKFRHTLSAPVGSPYPVLMPLSSTWVMSEFLSYEMRTKDLSDLTLSLKEITGLWTRNDLTSGCYSFHSGDHTGFCPWLILISEYLSQVSRTLWKSRCRCDANCL